MLDRSRFRRRPERCHAGCLARYADALERASRAVEERRLFADERRRGLRRDPGCRWSAGHPCPHPARDLSARERLTWTCRSGMPAIIAPLLGLVPAVRAPI